MNKLQAKIATLDIKTLKEMAASMANDFREGADLVYLEVLDCLEARMPEPEFVAFCDAI